MEKVTLLDWLRENTDKAKDIALDDHGIVWNIWDLLAVGTKAKNIPGFAYGERFRECVYLKGRWLISEETGSLLYELVSNTQTPMPYLADRIVYAYIVSRTKPVYPSLVRYLPGYLDRDN